MQREIIEPLGMAQSSFSWDASQLPDTAVGYDLLFIPYNEYLYAQKASAGLYTTAYDLANFVSANMTGAFGELPGRGILQPDTVETMTNYQQDIQGWDSWIYSDAYGYGLFRGISPERSAGLFAHGRQSGLAVRIRGHARNPGTGSWCSAT